VNSVALQDGVGSMTRESYYQMTSVSSYEQPILVSCIKYSGLSNQVE